LHFGITEHAEVFLQIRFKFNSNDKDLITEICLNVGKIPSSWIAPKAWPEFLSFIYPILYGLARLDSLKAYHRNQSIFGPGSTHWSYRPICFSCLLV